MATAISGRTESGDEFIAISEEDVKSTEFILNLLEGEVGSEELPYVSQLMIASTVWSSLDFSDISDEVISTCEKMQDDL